MKRLDVKYPGCHSVSQTRTLQRRIGEWRKCMAQSLILKGIPEQNEVEAVSAAARSPAGESPLRFATLTSVTPPRPVSAAKANLKLNNN
jgi:ribosomal protein L34E